MNFHKTFKKWSDEELQILKENYSIYTNSELQKLFFPDRTVRSIECKAGQRGFNGKSKETLDRSRAYQKTDEWKNKISHTKKKYFQSHDGWWKGKKRSEEQRSQMSKRRKGMWAGENNPRHIDPLNGSRNGRWKGGILPIYLELRTELDDWKNMSMKFCNYKCVITGGEFDAIHHTKAFKDIIGEVFIKTGYEIRNNVSDYNNEELTVLRKLVKEYHDDYGFGACLHADVHKLFHDEYGYTKFSPSDFINFMDRIINGEFNNWFEIANLRINVNANYYDYLKCLLNL